MSEDDCGISGDTSSLVDGKALGAIDVHQEEQEVGVDEFLEIRREEDLAVVVVSFVNHNDNHK